MTKLIVVPKETRINEKRVALTPSEVEELIKNAWQVKIESQAGLMAGYDDQDYRRVGATIVSVSPGWPVADLKNLYQGANVVVRVKRAIRSREKLESQVLPQGLKMIGFLDPLDSTTPHMQEWQQAKVQAISLDQLEIAADDPRNVLTAMSELAGKLALQDAIQLYQGQNPPAKIVIIGAGAAGSAAFNEAIQNHLHAILYSSKPQNLSPNGGSYGQVKPIDKTWPIDKQSQVMESDILDADIVITCARSPHQPAPLLIQRAMLQKMKKGSVIVDLALSEGGNVEGSQSDQTLSLGNSVIVTNQTGYPKLKPQIASDVFAARVSALLPDLLTS